MKKQKNTELNFLYMDEKYQNKGKKKKENNREHKVNNKGQKSKNSAQDDIFNFDNEIVIGVTKPSKKKKNNEERIQKKDNVGASIARPKNKINEKEKNKLRKEEIKKIKKNKKEQNKLENEIIQEEKRQNKTVKNKEIPNKVNNNKTPPNTYYETMQVEVIKENTSQDKIRKDKKTKNRKSNTQKTLNKKTMGTRAKVANQNIINQERKYKQNLINRNNQYIDDDEKYVNGRAKISTKEKINNRGRNFKDQNEQETGNKFNKKNSIVKAIVKWTTLVVALIVAIIIFMMSPLFDLVQIEVANNEKVSSETIISLSEIKIGENIYKNSKKQIIRNIKQNAYIESVKIDRKIPNKILITVKERKASFMLEHANSYAYINNQGYILEISEEKQNLPIIAGYVTNTEEIKAGGRLEKEDLEKLEMVLKIIESANGNGIASLITKINIQDKQNYMIELENEKKIVYLGDASNLSNRMLYLKAILEEEKGSEGEIFINGDLHKEAVYFRKKE